MVDELKPCPFCGGEAMEGPVFVTGKPSGDIGWVGCVPCGVFVSYTHSESGRREAMRAWNTRAERTCRIDGVRGGGNCGTTTYRLSCGHAAVMPEGTRFGHCPECGAKIEGGGR